MYPADQLDQDRRRKMVQEALARGLQRPQAQSFMPGESAGIPDFLRGPLNPLGNIRGRLTGLNAPPPANRGLSIPQPPTTTPNIDFSAIGPPTPAAPVETATPSPRIGYSNEGLTGVDRLLARRRALEEADPESKVTDTGEILPPHKTGRLSGLGQGFKVASANVDPNHPMFSLGALIGGGVSGLASPRSAAKESRRLDLQRLDTDVARGLKLEEAQAQVGSVDALRRQREMEPAMKAAQLEQEREIANAKLEIERQKAAGEITQKEADRQQRELDRRSREGIAAANRASQEKIAGMREGGAETRAAKSAAAQQEYDSLLVEEEAARKEKDRAYQVLDQMRQSSQPKEDIAQAEDAAKAADKNYQSYGEKKRDAQRRIRENQVSAAPATTQPYSGRTMSQANLERYAKDKGLSVEEARKQVEAQGVRVQ